MPIPSPTLDDRSFDDLIALAAQRVENTCPGWKIVPGDPAAVLLDAFAHLTEVLIYRLNRVPEKAYIEFLNLLGLKMQPPAAAMVTLVFTRARAADTPLEIPKGTRVTVARVAGGGAPPVFSTVQAVTIPAGKTDVEVRAANAEFIEAEPAGSATGRPGQSFTVKRPPIVARAKDLDLVVGIQGARGRSRERERSVAAQGQVFRVWGEVNDFSNRHADDPAYVVDRMTGTITFAPSIRRVRGGALAPAEALAAMPEAGKEVRAWYWRGGGASGNVPANTLTVLRDTIPGVSVTNPEPAAGGADAETLENALARGPSEFRTLERAVTSSDFEAFARKTGGIARAKAVAQAEIWAFATPGTVEVLLVPALAVESLKGPLPAPAVDAHHTELAREAIQIELDRRRPLGTRCLVHWSRYKTVHVRARVVAYREEDAEALTERFRERLYQLINPVAWQFGLPLRASAVHNLLLGEPGVSYVESLSFRVDDSPNGEVPCLAHVPRQPEGEGAVPPALWFAASGDGLYRSMNDGASWERVAGFPGQTVTWVTSHPDRAGLVAAIVDPASGAQQSVIAISDDSGEHWATTITTGFHVQAAAWAMRDETPVLFLAADTGLFEVAMDKDREVAEVSVDPQRAGLGFSAVTAVTDARGGVSVAIASLDNTGVYLSASAGRPGSFKKVGLEGNDVRVLVPGYDGARAFLWAGFGANEGHAGTGVARLELIGGETSATGWETFSVGWEGGGCRSIAFRQGVIYAASYQAGVLRLDLRAAKPEWKGPDLESGLPLRGAEHLFQFVRAVTTSDHAPVVICGGPEGLFASDDGGVTYRSVSSPVYEQTLPLPPTWLLCSGEHDVEVKNEP